MADEIKLNWPQDAQPIPDTSVTDETPIMGADLQNLDVMVKVTVGQIADKAADRVQVDAGLIDPTPPGTVGSPAVIPPGPAGVKGTFVPQPGFYQGFPEVTSGKSWQFYWNGTTWSLRDLGSSAQGVDVLIPTSTDIPNSKATADYVKPLIDGLTGESPNLSDNVFVTGAYSLANGVLNTSSGAKALSRRPILDEWVGKKMTFIGLGGLPPTLALIYIQNSTGEMVYKRGGAGSSAPGNITIDITEAMEGGDIAITVGANAYEPSTGYANQFMMVLGTEIPSSFSKKGQRSLSMPIYTGLDPVLSNNTKSEIGGSLANDIALDGRMKHFEGYEIASVNQFNKAVTFAGWRAPNGDVTSSDNLIHTGPIKVSNGKYHIEADPWGSFYATYSLTALDANLNPIVDKGLPQNTQVTSYEVTPGVEYIDVSFHRNLLSSMQISKSDVRLPYEEYGKMLDGSKVKGLDSSSLFSPSIHNESLMGNTPLIDLKKYDVLHFVQYGQSLSIGAETTSALTTVPVARNFRLGSNVWDYQSSVLNPLINVDREDSVVVTTNVFSDLFRREIKADVDFIATSSGVGSTTVAELSDEAKSAYPRFLGHVNNAKISAGSKTIACPAIIYIQGESDYTASNTTSVIANASTYLDRVALYKSRLIALKNKMQAHIMATYGQSEKPLFFVHNPGGIWGGYKDKFVQMAQIQACNENEDMLLIGSPYYMPAFNGGHLTRNGYRMHGEMIGKNIYRTLVKQVRNEPIDPKKFTISGNDIYIDCVVPVQPLMINTWQVAPIRNYGFDVYLNDVQMPISVSLVGGSTIKLSVVGDLATATKIQVNYGTIDTGNNQGCGNICDSDLWVAKYEYVDDTSEVSTLGTAVSRRPQKKTGGNIFGEKYPVKNWLTVFSQIIKG